ncbi:MAG: phytoene desaturase family protein, partial [Gemmatimonadales bacterium]
MTNTYDAIIIGAGHNGLVTAAYLAQAGQRVLVLERRDVIGGAAATEEIFPGYSVDIGSHKLGGFSQTIMEDLQLVRHGLEVVPADPSIFTPSLEGPALLLWRDPARTVAAIREISQTDAEAWMGFAQLLDNATALLQAAWTTISPNLTGHEFGDLWSS